MVTCFGETARRFGFIRLSPLVACLGLLIGCGSGTQFREVTESDAQHAEEHGDHHDHHEHAAPHGGHLIELGDHQYTAEVVSEKDPRRLVIYVLDAHAEAPVAVPLKEVTFTVEGGAGIVLAAVPQEGDAEGSASQFVAEGDAIAAIGDLEELHGALQIEIAGTPFHGKLMHDHDHDHDHDHEHGEDPDHDHSPGEAAAPQ
jgi:hypothetical protein